jgi:elongation factor G
VDVKVDFYDGKMHPVDSKDIAFQVAGKEAFKEAFRAAKPCLLEPIYNVEVHVPEEFMGNVLGDLSSRRGRIQGMEGADGYQIVKAMVPQAQLYLYSAALRSLTGGRGHHTEEFSRYDHVPAELESKIIAESKKLHEEEKKA